MRFLIQRTYAGVANDESMGAPNSKDVESRQKNRCFPEVMSMYPEYCRTEGSQILGFVILRL